MTRERYLRDRLMLLDIEYRQRAKPLIDELIKIRRDRAIALRAKPLFGVLAP